MVDDKKARQKICTFKGTKNLIIVPKLYWNAEYWCEWLGGKIVKQLQSM